MFLYLEEEAFDDFDERMYLSVWYDPCPNFSRYEGMCGYGEYWLARLRRNFSSKRALDSLSQIVERIEMASEELDWDVWQDAYRFFQGLRVCPALNIPPVLLKRSALAMEHGSREDNSDLSQAKETVSMGLLSGYAGKGLALLTELGAMDSSWKTFI